MEEILIVVLQLAAEFLFEMLASGGVDLLGVFVSEKKQDGCLVPGLMCGLGAGLAALVNLVHPRVFLQYAWMRVAMLIAAPVLAGLLSKKFCEIRTEKKAHFWTTFFFVLGFEFVRFCWASRK